MCSVLADDVSDESDVDSNEIIDTCNQLTSAQIQRQHFKGSDANSGCDPIV